ncbi:MAG TPA: DinB family protein [Thermodesulfobacteriota bacterium]
MIARLDAVLARLAAHAAAPVPTSLTDPDPTTGERWTAGQVWGHISEIVPYWLAQARRIVEAPPGERVETGRRTDDPARLAGVARGMQVAVPVLFDEARTAIGEARRFIAGLAPADLARETRHPRYGVMSLAAFLDRFIVGHLEEHAAQLDGLRS